MKACVVARPGSQHQTSWGGAFAEGLRRHDWDVEVSPSARPSDLVVLWGVRNAGAIALQNNHGGEICILERGYLGDRFKWTSVSFGGGLNGRGEFRGTSACPGRFFSNFGGLLRSWQRRDGYALLVGQVPGDMSLAVVGGRLDRWYAQTAAELTGLGYDVRFRAHPEAVKRGYHNPNIKGVSDIGGTLADAVAGAGLVVTYNSNTGVESVLAGTPTMAADHGSMAWDVTSHIPGDVLTPDREEWAARLAWKQWTLDEIASGECWARVGQCALAA